MFWMENCCGRWMCLAAVARVHSSCKSQMRPRFLLPFRKKEIRGLSGLLVMAWRIQGCSLAVNVYYAPEKSGRKSPVSFLRPVLVEFPFPCSGKERSEEGCMCACPISPCLCVPLRARFFQSSFVSFFFSCARVCVCPLSTTEDPDSKLHSALVSSGPSGPSSP